MIPFCFFLFAAHHLTTESYTNHSVWCKTFLDTRKNCFMGKCSTCWRIFDVSIRVKRNGKIAIDFILKHRNEPVKKINFWFTVSSWFSINFPKVQRKRGQYKLHLIQMKSKSIKFFQFENPNWFVIPIFTAERSRRILKLHYYNTNLVNFFHLFVWHSIVIFWFYLTYIWKISISTF